MDFVRRSRIEILVFGVALVARLAVPASGGGFDGFVGSDQAVYYASAMAVSFGRLPYQDFAMVHPPLVALVLQPAAWFGRLTTDHAGFIAANVMFAILGAVTAALVVRVSKVWGLGPAAGAAGGLFYAVWLSSVEAEFSARIEALGNVLLVGALLAWGHARGAGRSVRGSRMALLAGVLLGLTLTTKIWWAVPVLVILLWEWLTARQDGRLRAMVFGAVVTAVLVDGTLLLLSRGRMWDYVVAAQVGRPRRHPGLEYRLSMMAGMGAVFPDLTAARIAGVLFGVVMLVCLVAAWRQASSRFFAVLLVVQAVVLLASPSFFPFYADYLAVAAALTVAGAAAHLRAGPLQGSTARLRRGLVPGLVVALALVTAVRLGGAGQPLVTPIPGQDALVAAAADQECVTADLPMNLVVVQALSRSFEPGCQNLVDVRGEALTLERTGPKNADYKTWLVGYLRDGDAVIVNEHALRTLGLAEDLTSGELLATNGEYTLFRPGA